MSTPSSEKYASLLSSANLLGQEEAVKEFSQLESLWKEIGQTDKPGFSILDACFSIEATVYERISEAMTILVGRARQICMECVREKVNDIVMQYAQLQLNTNQENIINSLDLSGQLLELEQRASEALQNQPT